VNHDDYQDPLAFELIKIKGIGVLKTRIDDSAMIAYFDLQKKQVFVYDGKQWSHFI
jgi:hypothetical protein